LWGFIGEFMGIIGDYEGFTGILLGKLWKTVGFIAEKWKLI
jgi:hypothetical protein